MAVDTRKVAGRRSVHYDRLEDILADAERLAQGPVRSLGNWNLAQCCQHLSKAIHMPLDGPPPFKPNPIVALLARLLLRNRLLTKPLPTGFILPPAGQGLLPSNTVETRDALEALRQAIARWRREPQRYQNGLLGQLSQAEWEQFQCRHAESHMSFQLPAS